jgi:two-component system CheB/CheR fusion protein
VKRVKGSGTIAPRRWRARRSARAGAAAKTLASAAPQGAPQGALEQRGLADARKAAPPEKDTDKSLAAIINVLRSRRRFHFSESKRPALLQRIQCRMAIAGTRTIAEYIRLVRSNPDEMDLLANDLFIAVTGFFRDPADFVLAKSVVSGLVHQQPEGSQIRAWVPLCSTGEEAYSLAMLFFEEFADAGRSMKLQVFASDVSPHAIAHARNGLYPEAIKADVSEERLAHFFRGENEGFRVASELRDSIAFAMHNLLIDPPFSRLDLIFCRNLPIYLQPHEQKKILARFHFALREGGFLFLGPSQTVGEFTHLFEPVAQTRGLFRRTSVAQPGGRTGLLRGDRRTLSPRVAKAGPKQQSLGQLVQTLLLDTRATAAVLVNRLYQGLYFFGEIDRYMQVPAGEPAPEVTLMLRDGLAVKFRAAVRRALRDQTTATFARVQVRRNGDGVMVTVSARPVQHDAQELVLVTFLAEPTPKKAPAAETLQGPSRVEQLERELDTSHHELEATIRDLQASNRELTLANGKALSVNEEYQSANEELAASREELRFVNEELISVNNQLEETLARERSTADSLKTLMRELAQERAYAEQIINTIREPLIVLDEDLRVVSASQSFYRYFGATPADTVGRLLPETDAHHLDTPAVRAFIERIKRGDRGLENCEVTIDLPGGQRALIMAAEPIHDSEAPDKRSLISFVDITEFRRSAEQLAAAKQAAEQANLAKSRFLAAASHDLRQPLQALKIMQGIIEKHVAGEQARRALVHMGHVLESMAHMLTSILDIDRLETGAIHPTWSDFPLNELLSSLSAEFAEQVKYRGLDWRIVPCGLAVRSDRHLLEEIVRNLLANAVRYTDKGKVLLGCRRHGDKVCIEVWDTGVGISEQQRPRIFEEYHRTGEADRRGGLGLGLAIVQRLGDLLQHPLAVRSWPGKGSVFSVEVPVTSVTPIEASKVAQHAGAIRTGTILVIEDDALVRETLEQMLTGEGHHVTVASSGEVGLDIAARDGLRLDLLISDYNLPGQLDGAETASALRSALGWEVPAIILSGDVRSEKQRKIKDSRCVGVTKPVKARELSRLIQQLLTSPQPVSAKSATVPSAGAAPTIFVVEDDQDNREAMQILLSNAGYQVKAYASALAFLESQRPEDRGCVITDVRMPGMNGLEMLATLVTAGSKLPAIIITGQGDIAMAVQAIRAGAADFLEKPFDSEALLASVRRALQQASNPAERSAARAAAAMRVAGLTKREREVMAPVVAGRSNKDMAARLGINQRTIETHRAAVMSKLGVRSLSDLVRLAIAAEGTDIPPA